MTKLLPHDVATACGLESILPPGRFNGFINILKAIQSQLQKMNDDNLTVPLSNDEANKQISIKADPKEGWKTACTEEVAVLLSGGVDSSVALKLLQLEGRKVNLIQTS